MHILLIEDDLDVANSVAEFLELKGMSVDFAYNLKMAKAILDSQTFDLIILDINLPDGSGITLCKELCDVHDIKQPIIFLSARGEEKDKLKAFEYGAVDYVVKPFSMLELVARIENIRRLCASQERFQISAGDLSICKRSGTVYYKNHVIQLNSIATKIVTALVDSHPKLVTTERLSQIIWDGDIPISNPLRSHVSRINSEFHPCVNGKIVKSVRGLGYQLTI